MYLFVCLFVCIFGRENYTQSTKREIQRGQSLAVSSREAPFVDMSLGDINIEWYMTNDTVYTPMLHTSKGELGTAVTRRV